MNVGSLFSGVGGFDLGFERAGMRTLWFCEQDPYCQRVLARHWPGVPCHPDVRSLVADSDEGQSQQRPIGDNRRAPVASPGQTGMGNSRDTKRKVLPVPVPQVDVLCGGFPCQDISLAGKGAGITGERSGLWSEFARLIGELRPRYVVVENVPAITSRGLDRVLADLAALGFDAEWDHLPASAFGAPHRRDRFWLVAYPGGEQHEGAGDAERRSSATGFPQAVGDAERDNGRPGRAGRPDSTGTGQSEPKRTLLADQRRPLHDALRRRHGTPQGEVCAGRDGTLGAGWWATEPDVGGSLDGLSAWLDGTGRAMIRQPHELVLAYAEATHRTPAEALRALRSDDGTQDVWEASRGCGGLSSPAVLFAYLRKLANRCDEGSLALASPEAAWASLRGVWADHQSPRAPRRSGHSEQQPGEHSDALQTVSRFLALDAEAAWLAYRRSDACPPLSFEAGIARTSVGVPARVDRLRALGNSLVPQIAEWIGMRIMEWEAGA